MASKLTRRRSAQSVYCTADTSYIKALRVSDRAMSINGAPRVGGLAVVQCNTQKNVRTKRPRTFNAFVYSKSVVVSEICDVASSAPGRIFGRIISGPGCSATHGALATTSKNAAPVSRTVLNTSDSASAGHWGPARRSSMRSGRPVNKNVGGSGAMSRILDAQSFVATTDWPRN